MGVSEQPYNQWLRQNQGNLDEEFSDYYYGIETYGWVLVKENLNYNELDVLLDLNIVLKREA